MNIEEKKNRYQRILEQWENMKPFVDECDIPEVPIVDEKDYKEIIIPSIIRCGGIPKVKLVVGKTYIGDCRNASEGTWDGNNFIIKRYKFGTWFDDTVKHFEDYTEYDIFIPIKLKEKDYGVL